MSFTIHKHVGGDWSIEKPEGTLTQITWDEMLYEVATLLMAGKPHRHSAWFDCGQPPFAAVYSLRATEVEPGCYTIRRGGLFTDRLSSNEALGFLAAYTLTDGERQLFSGLMTYGQWRDLHYWNRDGKIAGLLTLQTEYAV